jgi:hypothetical protein
MYQGTRFQNAAVHLQSCEVTRTYCINRVDVGFEVLTAVNLKSSIFRYTRCYIPGYR